MRSIPVLLLSVVICLAVGTPSFAERTWLVEDGTATFSLAEGTLRSFGFEIVDSHTTARASAGTESMLEPPLRSFAALPSARFVTGNGGFRSFVAGAPLAFEGGIAIRTFDPATGGALAPVLLYDFEIVPSAGGEDRLLELRSLSSLVDVPFLIRDTGFRHDAESGRLEGRRGDILVSPQLADALGRPALAHQWIGSFDIELTATTRDPATDVPAPEDLGRGDTGSTPGLNVRLGELYGITSMGHAGVYPNGRAGLSAGTTSCNAGDQIVPWNAAMEETHPLIALALFRVENGVLEMLGKNWLKHAWYALSSDQCNLGCIPSDGTYLGIGCSDTYSSGNNGNRWDLGPREEVDPWAGTWVACGSFFDEPVVPDADCDRDYFGEAPDDVAHRLEVWDEDLGHAGADYYYEGQYIVDGETFDWDNIGWRPCQMVWSGGNWSFSTIGGGLVPTFGPFIMTWGDERHTVPVAPDDGQVILAVDVTDLGGGQWHYEYALYNWRSNRGLSSFSIPVAGANVTNISFRDIDKTGANDWQVTQAAGALTWSTDDYATDPNANALHYQTLFNFRFDADVPPGAASAQCGIFEPGLGTDVFIDTQAPFGATDVAVLAQSIDGPVLHANEPNPFASGTRLAFSLPRPQPARLSVLDVTGREIQVLVDGVAPAGRSSFQWNGRDAQGRRAASGVYFFRLETAEGVRTAKGTLLR